MNRYTVHYRNKKNGYFDAYSYTEDDKKYYFHQKEDESDKESFALKNGVDGIAKQVDIEPLGIDM